MRTFQSFDIENTHDWFRGQKFPLHISENSQCTLVGRLIFFDEAYLPGVGRNWGTKIAKRLGWSKWGRRAAKLDSWVYIKNSGDELRTIPFVWFVRSKPTFKPAFPVTLRVPDSERS